MIDALPSLTEWLADLAPAERQTLAHLWHLPDAANLAVQLTKPTAVAWLLEGLRPQDRAALERVLAEGGSIAAPPLEREFGSIRPHTGFVNPRAYLNALHGVPSAVERLFVLGLLARLRVDAGFQYAIPREWLPLLPAVAPASRIPQLAPSAVPRQHDHADPFGFERDLVNLLALAYCEPLALNNNGSLHRTTLTRLSERTLNAAATSESRWPNATLLRIIARDLGLLHERGGTLRVAPTALEWLAQAASERFASLLQAWQASNFDELSALAGLRWRTPPLHRPRRAARRAVLEMLRVAAPETWFKLDDLINEMQRINPDFARSGGDYDAWQLADAAGNLLAGWAHWRDVEGALIRAYCAGPLHWLGVLDVGGDNEPTHLRMSAWGAALLDLDVVPAIEEGRLVVRPDGGIVVRADVPPLPRFQVNRIAAWLKVDERTTEHYALTARSFDEAIERGIGREQISEFLNRWSSAAVPKTLGRTLQEWEHRRSALRGRAAVLLHAAEPTLLEAIADDSRLKLPPHTALNPTTWAFEAADGVALVAGLRDVGYGLMANLPDAETPLSERDLRTLLAAALFATAFGTHQNVDVGITAALLERIRRLLPSSARAEAERAANDLIKAVFGEEAI